MFQSYITGTRDLWNCWRKLILGENDYLSDSTYFVTQINNFYSPTFANPYFWPVNILATKQFRRQCYFRFRVSQKNKMLH
jgi:hypothetical protein